MLTHDIALPFAPGCFPRLRPEFFARFGAGFALPGRSSLEGGIEELPLLRETSRSNRRTRSSSAALAPRSSTITPACSRQTRSAPRARAPPTQTRSKIITAHSPIVTPDTPKINYGPECLPRGLSYRLRLVAGVGTHAAIRALTTTISRTIRGWWPELFITRLNCLSHSAIA
jgi:hypothetical protein